MKQRKPLYTNLTQAYIENEVKTNRVVAFVTIAFIIVTIVNELTMKISYSEGLAYANRHYYIPIDVLLLFIEAAAFRVKFRPWWVKYMLVSGVVLMSVASFAVFTTITSYYLFIPLIISTRYYNRKLVIFTSSIVFITFLTACVFNITLDGVSPVVDMFHRSSSYNSWQNTADALIFNMIPISLIFIFLSIFSVNITNSGRKMLKTEVYNTGIIAAIETELNMAANIQKNALPEKSFTTADKNFSLYAYEKTAREVGGDFYDYIQINDHTLAIVIADVSDKGVPAALFMMSAKKVIRCTMQVTHNLEESIGMINTLICQDNDSDMFLTLWLGIIDTRTGVGKYINGGHLPPLLKHSDGTVERITNEPDMFIGNFVEFVPKVYDFRMTEGDTLFIYTDGITDAQNKAGESYDFNRLFSTIESSHTNPRVMVEAVSDSVDSFSENTDQFDDETMLALHCSKINKPSVVHIETLSDSDNVSYVLDTVNEKLCFYNCPDEQRRRINIIIDELYSNISAYAYDGDSGPLTVNAVIGKNYIDIEFIDSGKQFNPLLEESPVFTDEPQFGGLGIYFVREMADEMSYLYKDSKNKLLVTVIWDM